MTIVLLNPFIEFDKHGNRLHGMHDNLTIMTKQSSQITNQQCSGQIYKFLG